MKRPRRHLFHLGQAFVGTLQLVRCARQAAHLRVWLLGKFLQHVANLVRAAVLHGLSFQPRSRSSPSCATLASMARSLTADFEIPTLSAMRGSTSPYCRVETPRSSAPNICPPWPDFSLVPDRREFPAGRDLTYCSLRCRGDRASSSAALSQIRFPCAHREITVTRCSSL